MKGRGAGPGSLTAFASVTDSESDGGGIEGGEGTIRFCEHDACDCHLTGEGQTNVAGLPRKAAIFADVEDDIIELERSGGDECLSGFNEAERSTGGLSIPLHRQTPWREKVLRSGPLRR